MAGHSHWKQIQHKKGTADQKRGQLFSKLLNAVSAAARQDANPQLNPRLRTAVEKARENSVPQENIERAIQRATLTQSHLEELTLEAYGPGGSALIIEVITDNKNRAVAEIKNILKDHQAKWAEPGSVRWAFAPITEKGGWQPKFAQNISEDDKKKLEILINDLEIHDDVQRVFTNASL